MTKGIHWNYIIMQPKRAKENKINWKQQTITFDDWYRYTIQSLYYFLPAIYRKKTQVVLHWQEIEPEEKYISGRQLSPHKPVCPFKLVHGV